MKRMGLIAISLVVLTASFGYSGVQYQNDFENPSSPNPSEAWPEWIDMSTGGPVEAVNGRIEWTGGSNHWLRLDKALPQEYTVEFDFFYHDAIVGRFSFWPLVGPDVSGGGGIFDRHNYFMRQTTHYFDGTNSVPSEGENDITLPLDSNPHRLRAEVNGDHVLLMYKDRGEGGWILIDDRDFPPFGDGPRYIQLGYNLDSAPAGLIYIDNFVVSYRDENIFNYSNNFDNPSDPDPATAWPELVDMSTDGPVEAVNGRIEWTGGSNHWLRLNTELPLEYSVEFDFFYHDAIVGRFSFWPLVGDDASGGGGIFTRHNYFLRQTTHYFDGTNSVPSEGENDITLPLDSNPHRLRAEVSGDHVLLMYKDRGEGGWILIDDRDFPTFGDGPRYIQLGYNLDSAPAGLIYIDNLQVRGVAANRASIDRVMSAKNFEAATPLTVTLPVSVKGSVPSLEIIEGFPKRWAVSGVSHGGVVSEGNIFWSLKNLSESAVLTYTLTPPRLLQNRVAGFSGSFDQGDGEERITGETAISILLPYLYREASDYDFSGSLVDGKNYPIGHEMDVLYAQGMDGLPSDVAYERPSGDGSTPDIGQGFDFPANADFHQSNPGGTRGGNYDFDGYRDDDEVGLEQRGDVKSIGQGITGGDWWRYTFDLGPGDQVLYLNLSINTGWGHTGDSLIDVYLDNQFKGDIRAPDTQGFDLFKMFSVGPFPVSGGVHSIVVAFPALPSGYHDPTGFHKIEVVRVSGVGKVIRQLTADGFFDPSQPLKVSLDAEAVYGSYKPYIEESLPSGAVVTEISDGGQQVGDKIIWNLEPTTTSKTVSYTLAPAEGAKFLIFGGFCDIGLPLARTIGGDTSVTNQLWLFGDSTGTAIVDEFDGSALGSPWIVEYGSDPALSTNYEQGVLVEVADGVLKFTADPGGEDGKFDEWADGRRAPMILRTDIPATDWRIETSCKVTDLFTWIEYHVGIAVTYNQGYDTDVSNDEYLFGFYGSDIRVELTNQGARGILLYHSFQDEYDWIDSMLEGNVEAQIAVTKRADELIFSAKLPGHPWQLVGIPVKEDRTPTRIGLFSKIWGTENFAETEFDNFTINEFGEFTGVNQWELY